MDQSRSARPRTSYIEYNKRSPKQSTSLPSIHNVNHFAPFSNRALLPIRHPSRLHAANIQENVNNGP